MGTYFINDFSRREIVRMSAAVTCATILSSSKLAAAEALRRTPGQILGPFYPLKELPQISDLTRLPGRAGRANGANASRQQSRNFCSRRVARSRVDR